MNALQGGFTPCSACRRGVAVAFVFDLTDGEARQRREERARTVTLTNALRPPVHKLAWQTLRGARHNATLYEEEL